MLLFTRAISIASAILFLFILSFSAVGQITTGGLRGSVQEVGTGAPIVFANMMLTHIPTGAVYSGITDDKGAFIFDHLKPGTGYQIQISSVGYQPVKLNNLSVSLGRSTQLEIEMETSTVSLTEVEISTDKKSLANKREGVSTNLDEAQILGTPSLNRSLQDITRLSPQGGQSSFGGTNYRFNNLSIDGASNNDVLGFQEPASGAAGSVASGTPGALAGTQPISLDAIQEAQVSLAPFDVQQGNFTGANINAVTRSGTNTTEGSVYSFGRNQNLTGKSVDEGREPIANYYDYQTGFRLGGAIKKNKLFYFINYERTERREPVLNAPGSEGVQIPVEVAQAVRDTFLERYNYDPGSFGDVSKTRESNKIFFRLDYNINQNHKLTLRDNFVTAAADNLDRGSTFLKYTSQGFTHQSINNSLVLELRSTLSNNLFNHLIISNNTVRDKRVYDGDVFPHVQINYNSANTIFAGTYREASIYGVDVNTRQLTNNLKYYKGKHTFTLGTSNEWYAINYRFLTAWNGRWEYKSLQDFYNDQPSRIRGVYNYTDNSFDYNQRTPSANFNVMLLAGYFQDDFQVNDQLSVSAGVRLDMQLHPNKVPRNALVENTAQFRQYNNDFGGQPLINPRVAFKYQLNNNETMQLRGGSGLFSGRIPFAWYAYAHYISGNEYGNIDLRPDTSVAITRDLSELREVQPNLTEINLVDDNFQLPRDWRTSIAWDYELPNGIQLTAEFMFSKNLKGIRFQSLNIKDSTQNYEGADNRAYYHLPSDEKRVNNNATNVFLLTNTNKGYNYFFTVQASKQFDNGLSTSIAYTYSESKDLFNGVRNSMAANFNVNQAVNSNDPDLSWSNFDLRHRIISTWNYGKVWNEKNSTAFNLVYAGRAGSPFSYIVAGDVDRDGSSRNDLFYIPRNSGEIVLKDITNGNGDVVVSAAEQWQQLDAYIDGDAYLSERRGQYAERNGGRTPWNHSVDVRFSHQLRVGQKNRSFEFSLDVINVLNLINYRWGIQTFVPNVSNSSYQLIDFEGIENNQPTYQFKNPQGTPWQIDQLNSRWQAQLGVRFNF